MQLYKWGETQAEAVRVGLRKKGAEDTIKEKAGFKIGASRRVFNPAGTLAQVEFLAMFSWQSEKALHSAAKVRSLAGVWFRLRIVTTQQENCRGCRNREEDLCIRRRDELSAIGQHTAILAVRGKGVG